MDSTRKMASLTVGLSVCLGLNVLCGCQSAESGGQFTGFTNPLARIPTQSEPPIATLDPHAETDSADGSTAREESATNLE